VASHSGPAPNPAVTFTPDLSSCAALCSQSHGLLLFLTIIMVPDTLNNNPTAPTPTQANTHTHTHKAQLLECVETNITLFLVEATLEHHTSKTLLGKGTWCFPK